MSLTAKELINLRKMSRRLLQINKISILYKNNKTVICIAKSKDSQLLKHIENLCYHFVKLEAAKKNLIIRWIKIDEQIANTFTKALGFEKLEHFYDCIMIIF